MPYPTHPDITFHQSSPGLSRNYRTKKTQMGDGYQQRVVDGINTVEDEWTLELDKTFKTEAKTLRDFLDGRKGLPFYWTPPRETAPTLWVCDNYKGSQFTDNSETASVVYARWFGADDA